MLFDEEDYPKENLPAPHPKRVDIMRYRYHNELTDEMVKFIEKHIMECRICCIAHDAVLSLSHDTEKDLAKDDPVFKEIMENYHKYLDRDEKNLPISKNIRLRI